MNQLIHPQFRTIEPRDDHALLLSMAGEHLLLRANLESVGGAHPFGGRFDLPGFGQSERRNSLMSPKAMGEFIVRIADAFGPKR